MNSTLPPARDLPPHAHARIRARLELAVTRRRRVWLAPALTGVAALILAAFFAWPAPTPRHVDRIPAGPSTSRPPAATALPAPGTRAEPHVPGVSPARQAQIEENCDKFLGTRDSVLYQFIKDGAGEGALLYAPSGTAVDCQLGDPGTPYNPVGGAAYPLEWLPGPVSGDQLGSASAGGDSPGNREIYRGRPGLESYAGRITSDVARVTVTVSGATHQAVLANGTYYLRIVHPRNWLIPDPPEYAVVRAYDADGALLGTVDATTYFKTCYRVPGGTLIPGENMTDTGDCRPAVPWR